MARLTVYLPDELAASVRAELPDLNVSKALQRALCDLLACDHANVRCTSCTAVLSRNGLESRAVTRLFRAMVDAVEPLVFACGTAEGAARVLYRVGREFSIDVAGWPLPRPTRGERQAAAERAWPTDKGQTA